MWKQMLPMKAHCGKSCIDGTARSTGENRVGLGGGFSYLDVVGMCDLLGIFRLFAAEYSVGHATHTDWRTQTENRPRSGDGNGRTAVRRDRATENQSTDASRKNKVAALASTLHALEGHFHGRVVIRHAAGVETSGWNQHVDLRPMRLQAAWPDAIDLHSPAEFASRIAQDNCVAIPKSQPRRILSSHHHLVAPGSGDGVHHRMDHAVKLLAPARCEKELPFRYALF